MLKDARLIQFIKFGIVGASNSLIYYGFYLLLLHWNMHYTPANILAFSISVVNSFYWNNKYVFKKKDSGKRNLLKTFIKTYLSYAGTGIILSNILLFIWVEQLGISEKIGPILNLFFTIPINYFANKYWAYRDKTQSKED